MISLTLILREKLVQISLRKVIKRAGLVNINQELVLLNLEEVKSQLD